MTPLEFGNTIYTHETKESSGLTEYRKQRVECKRSGSVCLTNLAVVSHKLDLAWNQVTNSMKAMTYF